MSRKTGVAKFKGVWVTITGKKGRLNTMRVTLFTLFLRPKWVYGTNGYVELKVWCGKQKSFDSVKELCNNIGVHWTADDF